MRKLIAIALVCAVASVVVAQEEYPGMIWAKGSKGADALGNWGPVPELYMVDTATWEAQLWTSLPEVYGHGFVDSGSKWYVGGGGLSADGVAAENTPKLAVYNPVAQGQTRSLVTVIEDLTTLPGFSGSSIIDLEWVNGELYYMNRHHWELTNESTGAGTDYLSFGKFVLDANGVPTAAVQSEYLLPTNRVNHRVSFLCGALAYNPERGEWAFNRGAIQNIDGQGNNHWWVSDDPMVGGWAPLRNHLDAAPASESTYIAAAYWTGSIDEANPNFPAEAIVYGKMQNEWVKVVLFDRSGATQIYMPGAGTAHGWGDFATVLNATPEPATLALLAIGGLGILARRRRA